MDMRLVGFQKLSLYNGRKEKRKILSWPES
jgi:hypothetical protein